MPTTSYPHDDGGLAVIDHESCLAWEGLVCKGCWHACPFPDEAIVFDVYYRPIVVEEACIGCGLCDQACAVEPSAISIRPASQVGATSTENTEEQGPK